MGKEVWEPYCTLWPSRHSYFIFRCHVNFTLNGSFINTARYITAINIQPKLHMVFYISYVLNSPAVLAHKHTVWTHSNSWAIIRILKLNKPKSTQSHCCGISLYILRLHYWVLMGWPHFSASQLVVIHCSCIRCMLQIALWGVRGKGSGVTGIRLHWHMLVFHIAFTSLQYIKLWCNENYIERMIKLIHLCTHLSVNVHFQISSWSWWKVCGLWWWAV